MPYRVALQPRRPTGELVTLRVYPDAVSAELDAVALQHEGLEAHIFDAGSHNIVIRGAGGVRLQVRETEVDRARAILDAPADEDDEAAREDEGCDVRCPRCELSYCFFERAQLSRVAGSGVLSLPALLSGRKRWNCHRCGHVWDDEKAGPGSMTHLAKGDPVPTFRLRRGNGGMGLFLGSMIGIVLAWIATVLRAPHLAPLGLALGAALLGWRIGRVVKQDVCSVPTCRALLPPSRETCPSCRAEIAGVIQSAEEHYAATADVRRELAAMRSGQLSAPGM